MIELKLIQGSDEWLQARLGKVTGTRLASAVGSPAVQKTLLNELVAERMTNQGESIFVNAAMQWGKDHEDDAIAQLGIHVFADFDKCGMMQDSDFDYFALSPDAVLVNEFGEITGGCEVKCPASKTHIEYLLADQIPKKYLLQVLGPMILSKDVNSWYFASYDPRNVSRPLFVYEATREAYSADIEKYREKLESFLTTVLLAHSGLLIGDNENV